MRRAPRSAALFALLAAACGAPALDPPPTTAPIPEPVVSWPAVEPASLELTPTPTSRVLPRHGTFVAVPVDRRIRVWSEPSADAERVTTLPTRNDWGQTVPMLALRGARDEIGRGWLRVQLPVRPNGSSGWIRAEDVALDRMHERIVVDLSERRLRRFRHGTLLDELTVGIGAPAFPTTTGSFTVWALVEYEDPTGPYGSFALGLTGFSEVITEWPGGGRMAIHGTADPTDRGREISYGCVRVWNRDLERLRDVPMGTPVLIRA